MKSSPLHILFASRCAAGMYFVIPAILSLSCASTPPVEAEQVPGPPGADTSVAAPRRSIAVSPATVEFSAPRTSLALLVRDLSAASGRSIVLMNGLELSQAGPYQTDKRPVNAWLDTIVSDAGLRLDRGPSYDFVFAPGYEVLNRTSVAARVDQALARRHTTVHFNLDTPLFSALALLSHSLNSAIIADNIVSDARCGEVHLIDVTVGDALDAILRSARVTDASLRVKSDADSVLLYSAGRPLRDPPLAMSQGETRPAALDRRVTLYLPFAPAEPGRLSGYSRAVPLAQALTELTRQTGLRFEAERQMQSLPVNPAVMVNVPLETALGLIVNQWPLPHFGFRIEGDTVRFVYLGPPVAP